MRYVKALFSVCISVSLLLLGSACSHLHVDTVDAWSPRDIETVAYVVKDAPDAGTDALVREQIDALGWDIAPDPTRADAILECEFGYKTDLNSESEVVRTLDSVHLRIRGVDGMRTQAVSDYFYAHGKEIEWEVGVVKVFSALDVEAAPKMIERSAALEDAQATESPMTVETTETTETTVGAQNNHVEVERDTTSISTPEPAPKQEDVRELENIRTRADIPEPKKVREPESIREPERMEKSPWVPRFQGWGLEAWGVEE